MSIKTRTLKWTASAAPDVTGYNLYVQLTPDPVTSFSQKFDLGNVVQVELNTLLQEIDGTYNIGLTAYDGAGNEGPMAVLENVPLDFTAPPAPTNLEIV